MGLTNGDVAELTYFFTTPEAAQAAGESIAAQTYEPRSSKTYDPYTDTRLCTLVSAAVHRNRSEETRVKRVIEHMVSVHGGRAHHDILRRAFEPLPRLALPEEEFRWPEVARVTPSAIKLGRALAIKEEHARILEVAYDVAKAAGCSGSVTAARVLEADKRLAWYGVKVNHDDVCSGARRVLERAMNPRDLPLLSIVKEEMHALYNTAGDAYRAARDDIGATRRQEKAKKREDNEKLLNELLGRKRTKERERFEARLRRAS